MRLISLGIVARRTKLMHIKGLCLALGLSIVLLPLILLVFPIPVHAATGITLAPTSGTVGTSVVISGEGFVGHLATICWDGQVIAQDVPITETGELSYSLDIPSACRGEHTIEVTDDSHWTSSTASSAFTVLPKIGAFPGIARPYTTVTIKGEGFAAFEKDIRITWDGNAVTSTTIAVDSLGKWSSNFNTPGGPKGEHLIGAFGSVTGSAEVAEVPFIISRWAKAEPLSGPVGTAITIVGFGFRIGEDGITINYDGEIVKCNIVAETDGSFSRTLEIPASVQGHHTIVVYGSSFTPIGTVPSIDFEVIPQIELQPASGNKGTEVTVKGTGFAKDEAIAISFDEMTLDTEVVANDTGSFSAIVEAPQSEGTEHTITAIGSDGNSAEATFITEKTPPAAPKLLSPEQEAKLEIFRSVGDVMVGTAKYLIGLVGHLGGPRYDTLGSPLATFHWSEAADSDDVSYVFQIAATDDFASPVLEKEGLASSEYTLPQENVLAPGSYSWRVKAIDDVDNESTWSELREFEVIPMSIQVFILSLAIPVAIIAVVVVSVIFVRRANRSIL
jgi:hypothetical protein